MAQTTNEQTAAGRMLGEQLREAGDWSWAYVDVSGDREDPRRLAALQRRAVEDALTAAGAGEDVVQSVRAELDAAPGVPAPVSRYVLLRDGSIVLSEVLPGHMHGPESIGHGPVPDLVPLVGHRPLDVPFLVVEVGREGGGFRAYRLGHVASGAEEQRVQGRTDTLHKVKGLGGWSQTHWQHHTEEIWKQTESEVAAAVDEAVLRLRPRLVVVAGDVRARRLLIDALSAEARAVVSEAPVDPRASDASDDSLVEHVEIALARVVAERRHDVEDLLRTHMGRSDGEAVTGLGEVVAALEQAQASVVAVDAGALQDRKVVALDRAPWVATGSDGVDDATRLGDVPAAAGIVRAAFATDAEVTLVNAASMPGGAPVAALLRWPTGVAGATS
jgi:hypothetical protein